MQIKSQIIKVLNDATGVEDISVEFSANEKFGDYSTNIALKNKELDPNEIVKKINKQDLRFRAEVVGRFINFYIKDDVLVNGLNNFDIPDLGKGKLAIVEYSSPNIAKPFGVGHLRSTVIGDSVANLMEAVGYKVMRDNHLGDWGTQFGKVICAIKHWGNIEKIEKSENPVEELVQLYVKFHEESEKNKTLEDEARNWFKKLEDGDSEARNLWQKCVDWSWVEFEKIYQLLNIRFDHSFNNGRGLGESFFESRMPEVIKELEEKKLLKVGEDGAKLVFFENDKYPPLMILKKDGSTLYSTRDLATDKYRLEKYNPETVINEVGNEQSLYFKQLFEIEKILGWYKEGQRVHVGHGLFLMDGKKMSTRAGKTVKLEEVLHFAIQKAKALRHRQKDFVDSPDKLTSDPEKALITEVDKIIGIGAVKYFDLSHQPQSNISFNFEKMLSMDGNSGPYIQYTYARTRSVLNKIAKLSEKIETNINLEKEELAILRILFKFEEVVLNSAISYSPNLVCNYLFELASSYNTFYQKHKIIGGSNEQFRVLLTEKVGSVLKSGLKLLGIEAPERM